MSDIGNRPRDLGLVDLQPEEMMFCMYMPVSIPGSKLVVLPDNLKYITPLLLAVRECEPDRFTDEYVYLTAKTLYVSDSYIGNRPGWHIDGYGTNDLNFIWSDRCPTLFVEYPEEGGLTLSDDCDEALQQMDDYAFMQQKMGWVITYPDKHLLRLDNTVIHASPFEFEPGIRTFIKVSISPDRYNLKGNAVNYKLPQTFWPLVDRDATRNHPSKEAA